MSNLDIIQTLSGIVEQQNIIIRAQAEALHQLGAACMEEETKRVNDLYRFYLGSGEMPDTVPGVDVETGGLE